MGSGPGPRPGHMLLVYALLGLGNFKAANCFKIDVVDNEDHVVKSFSDGEAYFQDRSYMLPKSRNGAIQGPLVYPVPRNACSVVETPPNDTFIAYLSEYTLCPSTSEVNLRNAGYAAMLAYTTSTKYYLVSKVALPRALITDPETAKYLTENVLEETDHSDREILLWDDTFANLEKLFIIFASTLMGAIVIAISVFCTILFCRLLVLRWRTRGLTRWQVRALPKRKYRKSKETAQTCSICLEEFKEGESIRVLPCEHVFHPKCVDEWLQKWNRTCPLCKSTIKRKGGKTQDSTAPTTEDETSHLVPQEEGPSSTDRESNRGGGSYGAMGSSEPSSGSRHRRNASGCSSHTSLSSGCGPKGRFEVTAAEIELSWESLGDQDEGRTSTYSPSFHTPEQSDTEINAHSFNTALGSQSSTGFGNVPV